MYTVSWRESERWGGECGRERVCVCMRERERNIFVYGQLEREIEVGRGGGVEERESACMKERER